MVPSRYQGGNDLLYAVNSNHVSIASGLGAILNGMFKARWPYRGNGDIYELLISNH